ncbi:helix-turn-helix domain-containing protein [Novosphingobium kaempferiae]|uniref:helix-turn-helix domain-containing protein n=1 Tax=Novosphingobium kaempferiae TaxID=2896849 RepID=UPI003B84AFDA
MSRTRGSQFALTHVQLAGVLGVGRSFVTRVISRLRVPGTIEMRRGVFIVKDEQILRETGAIARRQPRTISISSCMTSTRSSDANDWSDCRMTNMRRDLYRRSVNKRNATARS